MTSDIRKLVWMGAIPLQLQLHQSEVTTLPPPFPFMMIAPRNGYLPLLVPTIKPHFQNALPPGSDSVWFDYQGLPLKWHIPIGVLFDLLCAEPERPWNLTVHFRTYPSELLVPCEGEDAIKWNFINSLKEASYIMYGSTKNVMNMSQSDQLDLWRSVVKGDLEGFDRVSFRLKPSLGSASSSGGLSGKGLLHRQSLGEAEAEGSRTIRPGESVFPGKIPFRFYIRTLKGDVDDILDLPPVESWDDILYRTRPVEIFREGMVMTLKDALIKIVPHLFYSQSAAASKKTSSLHQTGSDSNTETVEGEPQSQDSSESQIRDEIGPPSSPVNEVMETTTRTSLIQEKRPVTEQRKIKGKMCFEYIKGQAEFLELEHFCNGIIRIQGIEPSIDLPLDWIMQNLCGPEQFIHVCMIIWDASLTSNLESQS